jgi:hypothetical protein
MGISPRRYTEIGQLRTTTPPTSNRRTESARASARAFASRVSHALISVRLLVVDDPPARRPRRRMAGSWDTAPRSVCSTTYGGDKQTSPATLANAAWALDYCVKLHPMPWREMSARHPPCHPSHFESWFLESRPITASCNVASDMCPALPVGGIAPELFLLTPDASCNHATPMPPFNKYPPQFARP